ncbi:hypothetical protein Dimus_032527 [Dionaea muscipula]
MGRAQTVETEPEVDEVVEAQEKSGFEPDMEEPEEDMAFEDDSGDDPMVEVSAAEEQVSEDEIFLKNMMNEAKKEKKRKRQAKLVKKSRKSKSLRDFLLLPTIPETLSQRRFKITPRWNPITDKDGGLYIAVAEPLNGILCLKVRDEAIGEVLVLWNSVTGPLTKYIDYFGLGLDPRTNKYKIFAISIDKTSIGGWGEISYMAEVYSLGSSMSWRVLDVSNFFDGSRRIDAPHYRHMYVLDIPRSMALSTNGRILSMLGRYKLLGNNGSDGTVFSMVSFDSSDEIFIETPLPPPCGSPVGCYAKMHRLLCHCPNFGATCTLIFHDQVKLMEIWDMIGCGPWVHGQNGYPWNYHILGTGIITERV